MITLNWWRKRFGARVVALVCGVLWSGLALANGTFACRMGMTDSAGQSLNVKLAGVPALVRFPRVIAEPPIILWHGFGAPANAEALMQALPLDDVPAIKVYLDLPLFGRRALPGGKADLLQRQRKDFAGLIFKPIVMGAAQELPAVVAALQSRHCIERGAPIGLFGFSAGGAAVLVALAQHRVPVSAAVVVNASTGLSDSVAALVRLTHHSYDWTAESRRLARNSDAISHAAQIAAGPEPPALLIIQGAADKVVGPATAQSLYEALQPYYRREGKSDRLNLVLEPGVPHAWASSGSAARIVDRIGDWFKNRPAPDHRPVSTREGAAG